MPTRCGLRQHLGLRQRAPSRQRRLRHGSCRGWSCKYRLWTTDCRDRHRSGGRHAGGDAHRRDAHRCRHRHAVADCAWLGLLELPLPRGRVSDALRQRHRRPGGGCCCCCAVLASCGSSTTGLRRGISRQRRCKPSFGAAFVPTRRRPVCTVAAASLPCPAVGGAAAVGGGSMTTVRAIARRRRITPRRRRRGSSSSCVRCAVATAAAAAVLPMCRRPLVLPTPTSSFRSRRRRRRLRVRRRRLRQRASSARLRLRSRRLLLGRRSLLLLACELRCLSRRLSSRGAALRQLQSVGHGHAHETHRWRVSQAHSRGRGCANRAPKGSH